MPSLTDFLKRLSRRPAKRELPPAPVPSTTEPATIEPSAPLEIGPAAPDAEPHAAIAGASALPAPRAPSAPPVDLEALLRRAPSLDRVRSRRSEDPESRANDGYQLLEALRDKVGGLLLLTATPMQLHEFELYSMVELV